MSDAGGTRVVWPWVLASIGMAMAVGVLVVNFMLDRSFEEMLRSYAFVNAASAFAFTPLAALILVRQPRHRVGLLMMWIGVVGVAQIFVSHLGELGAADLAIIDLSWRAKLFNWIPIWAWVPAVMPLVLLLPLYFPDGRLPSPRWRLLVWLNIGFIVVMGVLHAVAYFLWAVEDPNITFSQDIPPPVSWAGVGADFGFVALPPLAAAVIASVVVRFRRSAGVERRQLIWLLYGVSLAVPMFTLALLGMVDASPQPLWPFAVLVVAALPIPIAIGIAILRHQMFDIDVVVSKSILVAGLGGFIVVVYVGVVVGLGSLIGARGETDLALQVVATALVAVLFQPMKRRLDRVANRLVFGERATPYEVLSSFSAFAAETPDESSLADIATLLAEGTGADPALVWLRVGESLTPVASSSQLSEDLGPIVFETGWEFRIPGDLVVAVENDGEVLGAFSVTKQRGEQVTSQEEDLTRRLAANVALLLRNVRLTAELRARLDELHESRRRVVSAQDETRRQLERDLHDGAQQQLVALKVKLGLAQSLADKAVASKTSQLLSQLAGEADEAVDTLRTLARGIYPPLLESEGLAIAIESQARKATLPITVLAPGFGRYDRETEAAIYFCVLEAINNAQKYSNATSVVVRLNASHDELVFSVEDNGNGFDPTVLGSGTGLRGMGDRLDTLDGVLTVDSAPGAGARVVGRVPSPGLVPA